MYTTRTIKPLHSCNILVIKCIITDMNSNYFKTQYFYVQITLLIYIGDMVLHVQH